MGSRETLERYPPSRRASEFFLLLLCRVIVVAELLDDARLAVGLLGETHGASVLNLPYVKRLSQVLWDCSLHLAKTPERDPA